MRIAVCVGLALTLIAMGLAGEVARGEEILSWKTDVAIECMAVTPDGQSLCVGERGPFISIWDIESGDRQARLLATRDNGVPEEQPDNDKARDKQEETTRESILAIAVSPDGKFLAAVVDPAKSGHADGEYLSLWDLPNKTQLAYSRLPNHQEVMDLRMEKLVQSGVRIGGIAYVHRPVPSVAFAPGGKHIAVSGRSASKIWDIDKQEFLPSIDEYARFCSPAKGDLLATAYESQGVWLRDESKTLVDRLETSHWGNGQMVFSHDGQIIAIPAGHKIVLWRLERAPRVRKLNRLPERYPVVSLAFDSSDTHFVSGHERGTVALWSLDSWRPFFTFQTKEKAATHVTFGGPKGEILITAAGHTIQTWKARELLAKKDD
jgi:WD40 repeat protein